MQRLGCPALACLAGRRSFSGWPSRLQPAIYVVIAPTDWPVRRPENEKRLARQAGRQAGRQDFLIPLSAGCWAGPALPGCLLACLSEHYAPHTTPYTAPC